MKFLDDEIDEIEKVKAKSLMFLESFFKKLFASVGVSDNSKEVIETISKYPIEYGFDELQETIAFYSYYDKKIYICEYFFHLDFLEQIVSLIHEYGHILSEVYGSRDYNYPIAASGKFFEESINDLLSEIVINNALKGENPYLLRDGYVSIKEVMAFLFGLAADYYPLIYSFYFKNQEEFKKELFKQSKIRIPDLEKILEIYSIKDTLTGSEIIKNKLGDELFKLCSRQLSKFNLKELTSSCLNSNNEFFYHNSLFEKYIFERTFHNAMPYESMLTVDNMLKLSVKLKPLIKRKEFLSEVYNKALIDLYFKDPINFDKLKDYIVKLPKEIGISMFDKALKAKRPFNDMVKIIKNWDFTPFASGLKYISFYDQKASKKDRILFLSNLLYSNEVNSSYYKELLDLINTTKINDSTKILVIQAFDGFLKNNLIYSDDPSTIYVLFKIKSVLKRIKADDFIINSINKSIMNYSEEINYINSKYNLNIEVKSLYLSINLFKVSAETLLETLNDRKVKFMRFFILNSLKERITLMSGIEKLNLIRKLFLTKDDYYISIAKELDLEYGFNVGNSEFAKVLKKC